MKKLAISLLITMAAALFSAYNVGDTVLPSDNLSWTITGPTGNAEVGATSSVFSKINEQKAVFLFMGQTW